MNSAVKTLILSIISALVMALLIFVVYNFSIPNPNMILIVALVFFTGVGGWIPGAVSAVLIMVYSMFFFSTGHSFVEYTDENTQKIMIILIGDLCCYAVVSLLKHNRDKTHKELVEKAQADALVAELSQSVTSLLTNMPALTFSKDISTGKYLACNKLFAEYAHKPSPHEVVGLTDYDIFDAKTANHFIEDDKTALSMDEPYVFFEDVPDAAGNPRHFQTTKQKFYDQQGRLCTLGMSVDVTELVHMKQETQEIREAFEQSRYESLVYSRIAQSLSADYTSVYYVNLETEEYVEYRTEDKSDQLTLVKTSRNFFAQTYEDAQNAIYPADRESFLAAFTRENIIRLLDTQGFFTLVYRLMIDGKPNFVNMKGARMKDDKQHIVIGVMNVDSQMKEQENANRIKGERITYARINALTGDFIAIYSVDPETGHYQQCSSQPLYDELGIAKEGEDFFSDAKENFKKAIYHEDLEKVDALFTRAKVLKDIDDYGIFALRYRLVINDNPIYVRLKAALAEEEVGARLIVGIINISEQVKQDQDYKHRIAAARTLANKDELTGVKNKHAYSELEQKLNQQIREGAPAEFAIVVFDVNDLKYINDTYGHRAGDEFLQQASSIICDAFAHSPVFRIGGDEFVVIARGSDYENTEKLLAQVDASNQVNQANAEVVIAYGMARYSAEETVASVFEKADTLMYENKRLMKTSGR